MINFLKEQAAIWKWQSSTLGRALKTHTNDYFYGKSALVCFKQKNKDPLIRDFYQKVEAILSSPNPTMACRAQLAEYTSAFADLQVICLQEFEKTEMFYSENPYISAKLWSHIREMSDHNDELARYKWETPELTDQDLIGVANTRCALLLYYVNGLNMVRQELGDKSEGKDWFLPFVEACLVNAEFQARQNLRWPDLVPGLTGGLTYFAFFNYVVNGEPNPFFSFIREWPDYYLAGEGPAPNLSIAPE